MSTPILVITTDDGMLTDYTIMCDEMRRRGLTGTNFLIGRNPDIRAESRLNWNVVKLMQDKGWDFQCHTYTHAYLDVISVSETENEMILNYQAFVDNGIKPPIHTAYPGGRINDANRMVVLENRETTRFARWETTPKAYNTYEEVKSGVDIVGLASDIQDEHRLLELKNAIDDTILNNGVMVTYWHGIITPDEEVYAYGILFDYMVQFLDYATERGVRIMNYSEMINHVNLS